MKPPQRLRVGRPWVEYEIRKAWRDGRGVLGIYIHNLKCPKNGTCSKGPSPFSRITFRKADGTVVNVPCKDPMPTDAYTNFLESRTMLPHRENHDFTGWKVSNDIKDNIADWIEAAIAVAK